jgi:hypothetical protein
MDLQDTTFTSNLTIVSNILTTIGTLDASGLTSATGTLDASGLTSATGTLENLTTQLLPERYKTMTMDFITNFNNEQTFKINGWFNVARYVSKYLKNGLSKCFQCYINKPLNQQEYVRILNVTESLGSHDRVVCICNDCVKTINQCNGKVKKAPCTYYDVILDYLINEKYDLLITEICNIGDNTSFNKLCEKIDYMKFNINEKVVLLNNLRNENEKLSKNLEIEIEKHKIFCDHKNKNNELIKKIKKQFSELSIELFRENKKTLDEHINKYQELNQSSKYSIPECRICMQNEVKIAIQCGHLLCYACYSKLQNDNKQIENDVKSNSSSDILCCPLCRTYCNTYTQIYF